MKSRRMALLFAATYVTGVVCGILLGTPTHHLDRVLFLMGIAAMPVTNR